MVRSQTHIEITGYGSITYASRPFVANCRAYGVPKSCYLRLVMTQLTRDELDALLKKADDIRKQAQELQAKLRAAMRERAQSTRPAKAGVTAANDNGRKNKPRKRR